MISDRVDKTVVKSVNLLEVLAKNPEPMGVTELGKILGLTKSNTHRILQTWRKLGYVRLNEKAGKYQVSLKIWEIANQVIDKLSLRDVAMPHMRALLEKFNETVHLSILDGFEVIYIEKLNSNQPIQAYSSVGGRAPAYCVATGKAQLACKDDAFLIKAADDLQKYTKSTITNRESLLKEVQKIRKSGYALNLGEWRSSVCGLAAPIHDRSGVIAAIGISGPIDRLKKKTLTSYSPEVIAAANSISTQLGCLQ